LGSTGNGCTTLKAAFSFGLVEIVEIAFITLLPLPASQRFVSKNSVVLPLEFARKGAILRKALAMRSPPR
jgi:hypothetical protein